ncbi:bleomycin resistance protein [Cloacibacterium sp.]|uniref:bleomycin resistance protein n=1 Tax=Cloacibacterium sp. TaxID=1913682 RepID=UPI0035B0B0B5
MLTNVHPKLPMRDKFVTKKFYGTLGFQDIGTFDYNDYLLVKKDDVELHFFKFIDLDPKENYGQAYIRTDDIDHLYRSFLNDEVPIHSSGKLEQKPWGTKEFSILDPDNNLLTFGQSN